MIKLLAALALAALPPCPAAAGGFSAGGSLKTYLYSLEPAGIRNYPLPRPDGAYAVTENKFRLRTSWDGGAGLKAEGAYELAFTGRQRELAKARPLSPGAGGNWRVSDLALFLSPSSGGGAAPAALAQNLDRAFITWSPAAFDFYAGRQALAFGSARAVNPTDVLAPYPYGTIDSEERRGVDALRLKLPWREMGELDAGWLPGRRWSADSGAGFLRGKRTLGLWDVTLLSAVFRGHLLAGADLERRLGGAMLRLEAAQAWVGSFSDRSPKQDFFRLSAGGEYLFSPLGGLDTWLEYHYNGAGAAGTGGYASRAARAAYRDANVYLLGRHYLSGGAGVRLSPLVSAGASLMVNLRDRSFYALPSVEWNAASDLYLSVGALLPSGPGPVFSGARIAASSEFGLYDKALYASARLYF
ncbi:MAG: hypothetical protein A2X35_08370 [Elusimicrobia bacterium GWA2_61_42]|nr:MAG: hypothetical protein A2X35_08370 [Elusimicrobia bacterium GWA2_61_42]